MLVLHHSLNPGSGYEAQILFLFIVIQIFPRARSVIQIFPREI